MGNEVISRLLGTLHENVADGLESAAAAASTRASSVNPLPTSDTPMRHDLSIRQWEFIVGIITRRYTSVHCFCLF